MTKGERENTSGGQIDVFEVTPDVASCGVSGVGDTSLKGRFVTGYVHSKARRLQLIHWGSVPEHRVFVSRQAWQALLTRRRGTFRGALENTPISSGRAKEQT